MLCHAMLCYTILCYAMLCDAMRCDAILCYAMLLKLHLTPYMFLFDACYDITRTTNKIHCEAVIDKWSPLILLCLLPDSLLYSQLFSLISTIYFYFLFSCPSLK